MSIDLSLDRLQLAIQHLPKYTRPTCHIAGTNGKGSVTAIISSVLRSASPPLNVGRYNSPHLVSVTDCININDDPVDIELYSSVRSTVERIDGELGIKLSNFELLTLTALQIFERLEVDVAVVEVGMGGRLDATNIIPDEAILVSALTSVDLDHQAFLGDTVSAIAREKAGIARHGKSFVLGHQKYPEAIDVVKTTLLEKSSILAPLVVVCQVSSVVSEVSFRGVPFEPPQPNQVLFHLPAFNEDVTAELPLHGQHQLENLATALSAISVLLTNDTPLKPMLLARVTPSTIKHGINNVQWRGRLSFHHISSPRPLSVLVDGAHNRASAKTLADYINLIISRSSDSAIDLVYIIALSHSPPKTPLETLSPLLPPNLSDARDRIKFHVALLDFSQPAGMPWVKPVPPTETAKTVRELLPDVDLWVARRDAEQGTQLTSAIAWAAESISDAGLVVIAGSLYLVADFYRAYM
ncbi:hypothetical protein D9756_006780 [Leucocoprinus leucothites]|uniref:Dihydrofolate synthetase n=1 Tax=Leucocoprinus leucothites TaxID=201217 RepID=A0A8H5LH21_9AGAR|nr:hypothetical protein D9756_006780 [Leucoagaricus leucothites]